MFFNTQNQMLLFVINHSGLCHIRGPYQLFLKGILLGHTINLYASVVRNHLERTTLLKEENTFTEFIKEEVAI